MAILDLYLSRRTDVGWRGNPLSAVVGQTFFMAMTMGAPGGLIRPYPSRA